MNMGRELTDAEKLALGLIAGGAIVALILKKRGEETPLEMGSGSFSVTSLDGSWRDDNKWDDYKIKKFFRHDKKRRWKRVHVTVDGTPHVFPKMGSFSETKLVLSVDYGTLSTVTAESNKRGRSLFIGVDPGTFPDAYELHPFPTFNQWRHQETGHRISRISIMQGTSELFDVDIGSAREIKIQLITQ
jgi:hypothetical protein